MSLVYIHTHRNSTGFYTKKKKKKLNLIKKKKKYSRRLILVSVFYSLIWAFELVFKF